MDNGQEPGEARYAALKARMEDGGWKMAKRLGAKTLSSILYSRSPAGALR